MFKIRFTEEADDQFLNLNSQKIRKYNLKPSGKALAYMNANLRHPSLKTHKFDDMESPFEGDVFESYVQNKTPGAYRIFWTYGPGRAEITILAITPHPGCN